MQVKASLNNLRMTSRKVRLVANLVKGMDAKKAQAQLRFMNQKAAGLILKLLNSGLANAKHNFNITEDNLYIEKLLIGAGPSLKRWMPRAMGRATPILKRTCNIYLVLDERTPSSLPAKTKTKKATREEGMKPAVEKEETISAFRQEQEARPKPAFSPKPYDASAQSKKRFFSRQTFSNMKKVFRRKSI